MIYKTAKSILQAMYMQVWQDLMNYEIIFQSLPLNSDITKTDSVQYSVIMYMGNEFEKE